MRMIERLFARFSYFDRSMQAGWVALFTGRSITLMATSLLSLFLPVFWFETLEFSWQAVLLLYLVFDLAYVICLPLIARLLEYWGHGNMIAVSMVFYAINWSLIIALDHTHWLWLTALVLIAWTSARLLFWLPYHVDFARFSEKGLRNRQYSSVIVIRDFFSIIGPILSAFLIANYGFHIVFMIGVVLQLAAIFPFLQLPPTEDRFSYRYGETWRQLFTHLPKSRTLQSYIAYGAEQGVTIVIWPIFIYELLDGELLEMGAITSFAILCAIVLQLTIGKFLDSKKTTDRLLSIGSPLYALGWIIKLFVATAFDIFLAGLYHRIVRIFSHTPYDTTNADIAADEGFYIDEFTVLKEMTLNIGRAFTMIAALLLLDILPVSYILLLAALASLFLTFISRRDLELNPAKLRHPTL